jgi:FkbM family methyltransferase
MSLDWIVLWLVYFQFQNVLVVAGNDFDWLESTQKLAPGASFHVIAANADDKIAWQMRLDGAQTRTVVAEQVLEGSDLNSIAQYVKSAGLRNLHILKIDDPSCVMKVLTDLDSFLHHARIDFIQFLLNEEILDSIENITNLLFYHDYELIASNNEFSVLLDRNMVTTVQSGSKITVLHRRYLSTLVPNSERAIHNLFDIGKMTREHGIPIRGIIHIGAHAGSEIVEYLRLGAERILMIEANPTLAQRLTDLVADFPQITVVHCAITDSDGPIDFHLLKNDQCSSILPVSEIRSQVTDMSEIGIVQVPGRRLDRLLEERGFTTGDFNILNIDIQGAELLALNGAETTLSSIDAINIEINFVEQYVGSAQIEDVDDHLESRGFRRIAIATPYEPSWGDAFYVRTRHG